MARKSRWMPGERRRVTHACALILVVIATLLAATEGWSPPLPSVWLLLAIAGATRLGGAVGGVAAAAVGVAFALYTEGFTIGHPPDVSVWGPPRQRVVAFALGAAIVVTLALRWRSSGEKMVSAAEVWEPSEDESCSWLIAELEADGAIRKVNASGAGLLGHTPAELRGRSFASITHAPDREQVGVVLARLHRGRRTEPVSVRLVTAGGDERSFVGRAFRVSEAGHVVLTAAIPERAVQLRQGSDAARAASHTSEPTATRLVDRLFSPRKS